MAKNVVIRGVVYSDCPEVDIPVYNSEDIAAFFDTSDATISSGGEMLDGVTAYDSEGTKVTGTIQTKTSDNLTASGATVTVPAGYYATSASKSVTSGSVTTPTTTITATPSISVNSSTGLITASVSTSQSVTPSVSAGYVSSGTAGTVSVSGSDTEQLTVQAAQTITPTTSDQTIAAGTYLTGAQTIKGDSSLQSSNILYGVTIFNVSGSAQMPIISQDPVSKVLSIS